MKRLPVKDLEYIYLNSNDIWENFRNKSIFLTGGTGFFGKWLLESFIYANRKLALNATITSISRNPESFLKEFPFYKEHSNCVKFLKGDILDFDYNMEEEFHYVIHSATSASDYLNKNNPLLMIDTITVGTRRILDFAKKQPLDGFLFISSGAIYGKQPSNVSSLKESDGFKLDLNNSYSAYAEGKRMAELYCSIYCDKFKMPIKIARGFAFIGPYLPLDTHFAIGNFILNILNNKNIIIKGDGSAVRSYMYASDLTFILWKILVKGRDKVAYNVGSDKAYTLRDIAQVINKIYGNGLEILNQQNKFDTDFYVPNIDLLSQEFQLSDLIDIETAIKKTVEFYSKNE